MKISSMLNTPSVKVILFLYDRGEARYADLLKLIPSRGTLSIILKELDEEGLIKRRVVASKPIRTYYSLSEKGRLVAGLLKEAKQIVRNVH
ncbi:MAG: winged helix-turn-helix transcriptional regulator [Candidatus Bathyarchaeia archaeon]